MFLSANHRSTQREAMKHTIFNRDTGEEILRVVWANDKTGRYKQHLLNSEGIRYLDDNGNIASKTFKGNIELRKIA